MHFNHVGFAEYQICITLALLLIAANRIQGTLYRSNPCCQPPILISKFPRSSNDSWSWFWSCSQMFCNKYCSPVWTTQGAFLSRTFELLKTKTDTKTLTEPDRDQITKTILPFLCDVWEYNTICMHLPSHILSCFYFQRYRNRIRL